MNRGSMKMVLLVLTAAMAAGSAQAAYNAKVIRLDVDRTIIAYGEVAKFTPRFLDGSLTETCNLVVVDSGNHVDARGTASTSKPYTWTPSGSGVYRGKAKTDNNTDWIVSDPVTVVKLELKSVAFGGAKNHKVIDYLTDFAGDGENPFSSPEWTKAGTQNPICYEKDATQELTAVVTVEPESVKGLVVSIKAKHGSVEDTFNQTVNGGDNTCTLTTTNIKTVETVKWQAQWDLSFTWSLGSPTYQDMGFSNNLIYTIFAAPVGALTEKRLSWCTLVADGSPTEAIAAEKFHNKVWSWSLPPRVNNPDSWAFLDSGANGDDATLEKLCDTALKQIGCQGTTEQ